MSSGFISLENINTIAIGNFDGIHLGHQQLLKNLGAKSAIVVIENNNCCLTPGVSRAHYTDKAIIFYHLEKIKSLSANQFILLLQKDFPALKKVVVGYDFVFGHQRGGDANLLASYFEVVVIEQFCIGGVAIHSQVIRNALQNDYELAKRYLGREYEIEGFCVKGQGIGSQSLVPTINIQSSYCLPKQGVYKSVTTVGEKEYESVSFIGHRVTTDNQLAIETHLVGCDVQIKHSKVKIKFLKYMRPNQKFDSLKSLKKQILQDIEDAKRL